MKRAIILSALLCAVVFGAGCQKQPLEKRVATIRAEKFWAGGNWNGAVTWNFQYDGKGRVRRVVETDLNGKTGDTYTTTTRYRYLSRRRVMALERTIVDRPPPSRRLDYVHWITGELDAKGYVRSVTTHSWRRRDWPEFLIKTASVTTRCPEPWRNARMHYFMTSLSQRDHAWRGCGDWKYTVTYEWQ